MCCTKIVACFIARPNELLTMQYRAIYRNSRKLEIVLCILRVQNYLPFYELSLNTPELTASEVLHAEVREIFASFVWNDMEKMATMMQKPVSRLQNDPTEFQPLYKVLLFMQATGIELKSNLKVLHLMP